MPATKLNWTISLRMLLIATFGGLVFLSVAIVLGFSIYSNFSNTLSLLNQKSVSLLDSMEREIRSETNHAEKVIESLAASYQDGLFEIDNSVSIRQRLKFILRATPVIEMIHIYRPDGVNTGLLRLPNEEMVLDPLSKNLDSNLFAPGLFPAIDKPLWGEPLVIDKVLFHNVYISLTRNGKTMGTVVASIGRRSMNRIIVNLGRANDTSAFVLNANNEVIAHSKNPKYFKGVPIAPLSNFPDSALRKFITAEIIGKDDIENKSGVTIRDSGDRQNGYIFLTKSLSGYASVPYTLGAYFNKYDVLDEIERMFTSALLGLLALVLAVLAAIYLSAKISRPLRDISKIAGKFTRFEIDDIQPLQPSRVREINEQSMAINSVRTAMSEFTHYVPKSLVSGLVRTGMEATRSVEREVTIMFSDIVGFTKMSEHLNAVDTANLLNEHFELACSEIDTCKGTVDKFMGDGIMAYWGAPVRDEDQANQAFQAATNITKALLIDNEERAQRGEEKLHIRIGIHTGRVVVGNIGGGDRRNYTIIGDAVNVTQRLEQMGKELIGDDEFIVLVSGSAKQKATSQFEFVNVGTKKIRGRAGSISIFAFQPDLD